MKEIEAKFLAEIKGLTETLDNGYAKDWEGAEGVLNKAIIALLTIQHQIKIKPNITKTRVEQLVTEGQQRFKLMADCGIGQTYPGAKSACHDAQMAFIRIKKVI